MSLLRFTVFVTMLVSAVYAASFYDEKRDASRPPLSALQSSPTTMTVRIPATPSSSPDDLGQGRLRYPCGFTACHNFCRALGWCAGFCRSLEVCTCFC